MTPTLRTALALCAALLAACSGAPSLTLTAPAEGASLGPDADLDPVAGGLQIEVRAFTDAAEGSWAKATAGSGVAEARVKGGELVFPRVTLPDGASTLAVEVVDEDSGKPAVVLRAVKADSMSHGCRFESPPDGTVVRTDPGDSGLVQLPVRVRCAGLAGSDAISLRAAPEELPLTKFPAFDGTATFDVPLIPGLNLLSVSAPDVATRLLRVTLDVPRCRAELQPPPGTVFNLAGGGPGFVADREPASPLIQARVVAKTDCPDGQKAQLKVALLGPNTGPTINATVQGGEARFDLTLPDGLLSAQAFVGDEGRTGASRRADWTADSVQPTIRLTAPGTGQLLTDEDDAVPELEGLQVRVAGKVGNFDAGGFVELQVAAGSGGPLELVARPVEATGDFSWLGTFANGEHRVRAVFRRASGNAAATNWLSFATASAGGAKLTFAGPVDGDALGRALLVPQPGGTRALALFKLHGDRLPGAAVALDCGGAPAQLALDQTGNGAAQVEVPLSGCTRRQVTCRAQATGPLGAVTASIKVDVDAVAPVVALLSPLPGATRTAQADVAATTSCPGELQTWTLQLNGAPIGNGTIAANALSVSSVALQPGDNTFALVAKDEVGNTSDPAVATVTLLAGVPQPVFDKPLPGATLGAGDDVDSSLANGLQIEVRVRVDNRPAGTLVALVVSNAAGSRAAVWATTQAASGHLVAVFPAVAVPEGAFQLAASVTDPVDPPVPPQTTTLSATAATGRPLCDLTTPADGTIWTGADDQRAGQAGFQHDVVVRTSGNGAVTLTLTPPSGAPVSVAQVPAGSGVRSATFAAQEFPLEGTWTLDASCAQSPGPTGRAPSATAVLQLQGPSLAFVQPLAGALLKASDFDAQGKAQVQVQASGPGVAGGSASLGVDCGGGAQTVGPLPIPAGGLVTFAAPLVAAGQEGPCTLTASGAGAAGQPGLGSAISITADRSVPAPAFALPLDGAQYGPAAAELDCTTPSLPLLKKVSATLADPVPAAGLRLTLDTLGLVAVAPTSSAGGWEWAAVPIAAGPNTLTLVATDSAGNASAPVSASFVARCTGGNVVFSFVASGAKFGASVDLDGDPSNGLQVGATITSALATGSTVRICSTLGDTSKAPCSQGGYYPVATQPAAVALSGGTASATVTLADGAQTVLAEVTDAAGTEVSAPRSATVRVRPPVVSALALLNDTSPPGGDGALNQAELDASASLQFQVGFATTAGLAGQQVQIFATSLTGALGTATAAASGPTTVAVPRASVLGGGGYQGYVFYAKVADDAGNVNSIPGAPIAGDPPRTLGTNAAPFVIAPSPSVALTRPASGAAKLLAADDARCAGTCPGTDPLRYALSAQTNAPDSGSTLTFLLDGAPLAGGVSPSGGVASLVQRDLANGAARALAVRVQDPWGNTATSTARTVLIDSVPPALSFSGVPTPPDSYPQTITVTTSSTLEAGRTISVFSSVDGLVGSAPASGASTSVTIRLVTSSSSTPHQLTASATDAAGNPGTSAPLAVLQQFSGPTITLAQPPPTSGTVWFGLATKVGSACQPTLRVDTTNTPDSTTSTLWVSASADCNGAHPASAERSVTGNVADFTGALTFADQQQGWLCGEVTVAAQTAHTAPQAFGCDLSTPQVAFTAPAADGQLYVAAAPTLPPGAIASQGTDPLVLVADFTVTVTAPAGSTVGLFADGAGAPFASTALATAASAVPVSFAGAQVPIAAAQALAHALVAKVTAPSGNAATSTPRSIDVDVNPPAAVAPGFTLGRKLSGVVTVVIPTLPGDDGAAGGNPAAWDVRYSLSVPLTKANWGSAGTAFSGLPGIAATTFDLRVPTDQDAIWIGVRAKDRVGNLGDFADQGSTPTVVTRLTRTSVAAGTVPNGVYPASPSVRVRDVDGDGWDDVIVAYPTDGPCDTGIGFCDGRVHVYFGSDAGLVTPPLALAGTIATGALGFNQSFDVGDFDGDGKADVAAAETDLFSAAAVHVWTGAAIAAACPSPHLAACSATPARIDLTDTAGNAYLGGTVRAVGRVVSNPFSPGADKGEDLALTNYTSGAPAMPAAKRLFVFARGGAWLAGSADAISHAPALWSVAVALPTSASSTDFGATEAAPLGDVDGTGGTGLYVAFLQQASAGIPYLRDLRAYGSGALRAGASVALASGKTIPAPADASTDFGTYAAGGGDAVGGPQTDLLIGDPTTRTAYLYEATSLAADGAAPVITLDPRGEGAGGDAGAGAAFLPDLDGDGKAEFTGWANVGKLSPAYVAFGWPGAPVPAPPLFSFFNPNPPFWSFFPSRGQRVAQASGAFGQAVLAGHFSSADPARLELVVLSHMLPTVAPVTDTLVLLR